MITVLNNYVNPILQKVPLPCLAALFSGSVCVRRFLETSVLVSAL